MARRLEERPYTSWQLIKAYWQSEYWVSAYLMIAVVLLMTVGLVVLEVLLNYWFNDFYDALQEYDKRSVFELIAVFLFLVSVIIVVNVYRYYLQSYLGLRWRRWLTEQFLDRWLAKRSYYYLEVFEDRTDNPDQRIQEDIGSLVINTLNLLVGLVASITTLFAFITILWKLSGVISIPLGSLGTWHVPGYLAWVGVIYAIIGTWITFKIGRPLVMLNFEQQRREANFRFAAVDLRTHSEHVALYRGEQHQKTVLNNLVDSFLNNWYLIILRQKLLLWFTAGYNQIAVLVPLVVALPNYFSRVFKLGGLIQTLKAFDEVNAALSFLVNSFTTIAEWRAVLRRLITFLNHIYEVEQSALIANHFNFHKTPQNKIAVKNVNVLTPRNETLLENVNEEFLAGEHVVIKGVSGIGKSTFVRAIAGIWPYGSGDIILPENKKIMYIPQKSYMPLGTLYEALLFPDKIATVPEKRLFELLDKCNLSELKTRLHDTALWSQQLSPGEQQRVAFIRVFIHKPDWVILDESTSALDIVSEKMMYELLKNELPSCTIISVGHRPSLSDYHNRTVDMEKYSVQKVTA